MSEPINTRHGLTVETSVAVTDFEALGRWLAMCSNEQQAKFLVGAGKAFSEMNGDGVGLMQLSWIDDALMTLHGGSFARQWVADLHNYLNGPEGS